MYTPVDRCSVVQSLGNDAAFATAGQRPGFMSASRMVILSILPARLLRFVGSILSLWLVQVFARDGGVVIGGGGRILSIWAGDRVIGPFPAALLSFSAAAILLLLRTFAATHCVLLPPLFIFHRVVYMVMLYKRMVCCYFCIEMCLLETETASAAALVRVMLHM